MDGFDQNEHLKELPDDGLWQRWKQGDEASFRELLRCYSDLVWAVCRRILFREQDSQDGFQITFLTLFRRGDQIHGKVFGPWIRRVAFHAALQIRDQRIQTGMSEVFNMDEIADADNTFERIEKVERNLTLEQALNSLPEHLYDLTVQFHFEGRTRAEIAKNCQITESKVKSRLQQARQKLREHLTRKRLGTGALLIILSLPEFAKAAPRASLIEETVSNLNAINNQTGLPLVLEQSSLLERKLFMTSKTLGLAKGACIVLVTAFVVSLLSVLLSPNIPSAASSAQTVVSTEMASEENPPQQIATYVSAIRPTSDRINPVPTHVNANQAIEDQAVQAAASIEFGKEGGDSDIAGHWSNSNSDVSLNIDSASKLLKFSVKKFNGLPYELTAVGEYRRIGDMLVGVVVCCQVELTDQMGPEAVQQVLQMKAMLDSFSDQPFMFKVKSMESSIFVRDIRIGFPPNMMEGMDGESMMYLKALLTGEFKK